MEGREHYHRSLVVGNDEQGDSMEEAFRCGEKESGIPPSPRWHLLPIIITMVGDDDYWS